MISSLVKNYHWISNVDNLGSIPTWGEFSISTFPPFLIHMVTTGISLLIKCCWIEGYHLLVNYVLVRLYHKGSLVPLYATIQEQTNEICVYSLCIKTVMPVLFDHHKLVLYVVDPDGLAGLLVIIHPVWVLVKRRQTYSNQFYAFKHLQELNNNHHKISPRVDAITITKHFQELLQ